MSKTVAMQAVTLDPAVQGPIWSHGGEQMDVNILYFDNGEGVTEHINHALDVWLVVIQGEGVATIDGETHPLEVGTCLYITAGAARAMRSTGGPLVYASAHRKRGGLMPTFDAPA